jgi:GNAT superfamily N-acetyltransferase
MADFDLVTAADISLMQGLAQRVTAIRPDLVNSDGSVTDVTGAYLGYQVYPGHAALVDDVIGWYDATAAGLPRTVAPSAADEFALTRWAAHGYQTDPASLGDVRQMASYRGDLHVLVEAPDGTMAASTIMWLDEANQTAEFEPVGTHPGYRRLGLGTAMLRHGMQLARRAGATHMTVACLGAPGHPQARGLYYGVGFRKFTRDAPLIKPAH